MPPKKNRLALTRYAMCAPRTCTLAQKKIATRHIFALVIYFPCKIALIYQESWWLPPSCRSHFLNNLVPPLHQNQGVPIACSPSSCGTPYLRKEVYRYLKYCVTIGNYHTEFFVCTKTPISRAFSREIFSRLRPPNYPLSRENWNTHAAPFMQSSG